MLSIGLGSKKDLSAPVGLSATHAASSLSIFTVCARQHPPNALVGIVASIEAYIGFPWMDLFSVNINIYEW